MKIRFLTISLIFIITAILQGDNIDSYTRDLSKSKTLEHIQWGVYAEYTESGTVVIDVNSDMSLAPASGLKALTTGIALSILGKDFRYSTPIYYSGKISRTGILNGDIIIKGMPILHKFRE